MTGWILGFVFGPPLVARGRQVSCKISLRTVAIGNEIFGALPALAWPCGYSMKKSFNRKLCKTAL
jgi:hypothetical protein